MAARKLDMILAWHIRESHPTNKDYYTDGYYAKLGNRLLDDFNRLHLNLGENTAEIIQYAAILLANYMEDIVADSGQWRMFSGLCKQMFGQDVPMYHTPGAEYYPDEPSLDAVKFLVWHAASEMNTGWREVDADTLHAMSMVAFDRLDREFEQTPINDELTADIDKLLQEASTDFLKLRNALVWMFQRCYLTRGLAVEELIRDRMDESEGIERHITEESMRAYHTLALCLFTYKAGPLAFKPEEYLAALMRTKGMFREAEEVMNLEVLPSSYYKYTVEENGQWLHLTRTDGRKIRVGRDEIRIDDEGLRRNTFCWGFFVKYLGAWNLNGVVAFDGGADISWDDMVKRDPDYHPEGICDATGEILLEKTGGQEIFYFKDQVEMQNYMMKKMGYRSEHFEFLHDPDLDYNGPVMFIDRNAKKYALHFSFGISPCIADPANPHYDAAVAREEAVELLWDYDTISTEAMQYLLDHDYLPDLYSADIFSRQSTPEEKRADARFLLRYMRAEHY